MGLGLDGMGFWVTCLAIANRAPKRGALPRLDEIAFIARVSEDIAFALIEKMISRKLLVRNPDGTFGIHDWEVYQAKTDAERQRDKRERDRSKSDCADTQTDSHDVSRDVTDSHDVSRDVPNVTKERRGEEKREEEDPLTPTGGILSTDASPKKSRTKLPGPPEGVPDQLWADWIEHRSRGRSKPSVKAGELWIRDLAKLKAVGHDLVAVIEQSIAWNWSGLFPVRKDSGQSNGRASPSASAPARRLPDGRAGMTPEGIEHMKRLSGELPPKKSELTPCSQPDLKT